MAKVLLLEDDTNLRLSLAEVLEDEDYVVYQAADSEQALACARHTALDLVVSDVRMAGLDGLDTLQLLLAQQPQLKSIVMTGYADEHAPVRAVRAQASDYLHKPFSREVLLTAVRRVLEEEKEGKRYQGLLQRFVKGYQGLMSSAQLLPLEKDRDRVFQGYFVLLRSERLSRLEGQQIWERLGSLEAERNALKTEVDKTRRQKLAEGYRALAEMLGTLTSSPQAPVGGAARQSTPEERLRFATLHERLLKGRLSLEQLKLAALLDQLSALVIRDSPELLSLYEELWGKASLDSR